MNKSLLDFTFKWKIVLATLVFLCLVAVPFAGGTASADAQTILKVEPGQITEECTLPVTVTIAGLPQGQAVNGLNLKMAYNPALLQYQSNQPGSFSTGWTWFTPTINNAEGTVEFSAGNFSGSNPPAAGTVLTLTFKVIGNGTAQFSLPKLALRDSANTDIALTKQIGEAVLSGCGQTVTGPTINVVPGQITNCTLPVTVSINGLPQGQAVNGLNLKMAYNPALLQYQSNQSGSFSTGWTWFAPTINNTEGTVEFSAGNLSGNNPPASGTVLTLTFKVIGNGTAQFSLPKLALRDSANTDIALTKQIGEAVLSGCPIVQPTVLTSEATEVNITVATLNGSITANGGGAITEYGFYWGTTEEPTGKVAVGTTDFTGAYTFELSSLAEDTTYYYKAYAVNSAGTGYGIIKSFKTGKTPPVVEIPTVLTSDATEVGTGAAVLNGSINANGGGAITEYGFYWGTTEEPTGKVAVGTTDFTGAYTTELSNLAEDTTYYYKAYAVNSAGTGYGIVKSFTTESGTSTPSLEVAVELSRVGDVNFTRPLGIEGAANESVDWVVTVKDTSGSTIAVYTPALGTAFSVEYQPEQTDLPFSAEYTVEVTATPAAGDPVTVTKTFSVSNYSFGAADLNVSGSGGFLNVSATVGNLNPTAQQVQGIFQVTNSAGKVVDLHIGDPLTVVAMGSEVLQFTCSDLGTPGTYHVQLFIWLQTDEGWIVLGAPVEKSFTI